MDKKSLLRTINWDKAGYKLPDYDREYIRENTKKSPNWIHLGGGNIFRAFLANIQQDILNAGKSDKGIIVAVGHNYENIEKVYKPYDNLTILVTLKSDGDIEKTLIGSVMEALAMNPSNKKHWERLKNIFTNPSLQMVSLTITEKGYNLFDGQGKELEIVANDFKYGPRSPKSYIGKLTSLIYERYIKGKSPIALVSLDNCSKNGEVLYNAIKRFADTWVDNGIIDKGFIDYINNPKFVTFPWTMIDKITPGPDQGIKEMLVNDNLKDNYLSDNNYEIPFVNAEQAQYLIIEDDFPNGRPNLEEAGVIFTDRDTVNRSENMKVATCLNPLHTTLAIFGCLLGYTLISETMEDHKLRTLVEKIGYIEGLPVVENPVIIDPKEFIDEVLQTRFTNPFLKDTPQRIATDTSQKLSIRFGQTIKAYIENKDLDVSNLKYIPLVFAGWCRYLMGIDDKGNKIELSPDPLLEEVTSYLSDIKLGDKGPFHTKLKPILSNSSIFGVDLYQTGLGEIVERYFSELASGKGAVRTTLKKYLC